MSVNELVSQVRAKLKGKTGVGPRLPYLLGLVLGFLADLVTNLSGKNLPISSLRVKKFVSTTQFNPVKGDLDNFTAPFSLTDGLEYTLESEFISPNPKREIFYTE